MHNYDAIIWFGGIGLLLFAWLVAFIIHHRLEVAHDLKVQREADLREFKAYFRGWDDGAETALELVATHVIQVDTPRQPKHPSR